MICQVVKPVYGMAQAGRRWQRTLFPWLTKLGFVACESEPCVFTLSRNGEQLIVGCYVDDLAILYGKDGKGSLYQWFTEALLPRVECRRRRRAD